MAVMTPSRWHLVALMALALATHKRIRMPDADVLSARSRPVAPAAPKEIA